MVWYSLKCVCVVFIMLHLCLSADLPSRMATQASTLYSNNITKVRSDGTIKLLIRMMII